MGVGQPAHHALERFAAVLHAAFGEIPYHVGSSVMNKTWRDVDVRVLLPDDVFDSMFPVASMTHSNQMDRKWAAFCEAFSVLGQQMTGLPIDFQIQRLTQANRQEGREKGACRSALTTWVYEPALADEAERGDG